MSVTLTLALAASFLVAALLCGWRGALPPDPARGPRLLPYRFLMLLFATGLMMMVVHLVNLLGVTTGR